MEEEAEEEQEEEEEVTGVFGHSSHAFVLPSPPFAPKRPLGPPKG